MRRHLPSVRLGISAAALMAVVLIVALVGYRGARPPAPRSAPAVKLGRAPAFTLTDQNGRSVASTSFAGRVQVVSFLFPYCTTYCPLIARTEAVLQSHLGALGLAGRTQLVSFNVDPAGAGPAQLAAFLREFRADPTDGSWEFLTGTPEQIHQTVYGGFHVLYQRVSVASENASIAQQRAAGTYSPQPVEPNPLTPADLDYDIVHNDLVEVVAPDGRITAMFPEGSKVNEAQLVAAIRAALSGR